MEDREKRYKGAFFSGDAAEYESAQLGMVAMMGLQEVGPTPSPERLGLLHMLRWSAKRCPSAAYNLGNYLEGSIKRNTPKRNALALKLFERAVEMCVLRLDNAYGEFDPQDVDTNQVKDILSRSLTNIGAYLANTGHSDIAENYFRRSIEAYPLNDNSFICLGNIGLNQYGMNGVDLLEAVEAWEEGDRLGQQVIGFGDDVDPFRLALKMSRKRLVEVFRTLENWLTPRSRWIGWKVRCLQLSGGKIRGMACHGLSSNRIRFRALVQMSINGLQRLSRLQARLRKFWVGSTSCNWKRRSPFLALWL